MKKEHAVALFEMAGFDVKSVHELPNGYWPPAYVEARAASPWWLLETQYGLVKIGWRKRVISIDWEPTGFSDQESAVPRGDQTTATEHLVHAWTYPKALEYLTTLRLLIAKQATEEAQALNTQNRDE